MVTESLKIPSGVTIVFIIAMGFITFLLSKCDYYVNRQWLEKKRGERDILKHSKGLSMAFRAWIKFFVETYVLLIILSSNIIFHWECNCNFIPSECTSALKG